MSWIIAGSSYTDDCFEQTDKYVSDNGTYLRRCVKEFTIQFSKDGDNKIYQYKVKPGFLSDGASIPVFAQPIVNKPWDSKNIVAYLIHDIGYSGHYFSKSTTDEILKDTLKLSWNDRYIVYYAVKFFGNKSWDKTFPLSREETNQVVEFTYKII